jgi:uroporphyrinogen-III synthase
MTGGLPLIVTRPEPGNQATIARARGLGLDAHAAPLFAAHPRPWTAPDASDFDALLLTSAQAVRLAGPDFVRLASLPAHAVGAATADAARAAGLTVVQTGTTDAQRLLDAMTSKKIRRILWLCGEDRSEFDRHGAVVEAVVCYAVDPVEPPAAWASLIAAPAVLLTHSARGAQRVAELVGAARGHLALVAISPAAAAAAGGGWAELAVPEQPEDAAMLALAHRLCHKGEK